MLVVEQSNMKFSLSAQFPNMLMPKSARGIGLNLRPWKDLAGNFQLICRRVCKPKIIISILYMMAMMPWG